MGTTQCASCKSILPDHARFCNICGHANNGEAATAFLDLESNIVTERAERNIPTILRQKEKVQAVTDHIAPTPLYATANDVLPPTLLDSGDDALPVPDDNIAVLAWQGPIIEDVSQIDTALLEEDTLLIQESLAQQDGNSGTLSLDVQVHALQQYPHGLQHEQQYSHELQHEQQYPHALQHEHQYPHGLQHEQQYSHELQHEQQRPRYFSQGRRVFNRLPTGLTITLTSVVALITIAGVVAALLPKPFLPPGQASIALSGNQIPGGSVIIHGSKFTPGGSVTITLDGEPSVSTSSQNTSASSFSMNTDMALNGLLPHQLQVYASITVRGDGSFDALITLPQNWETGSTHLITATEDDSHGSSVRAQFNLVVQQPTSPTPTVTPSPVPSVTPTATSIPTATPTSIPTATPTASRNSNNNGPTNSPGGQSPVPAGINPSSGPNAGGTTVIITGKGFTGATGVSFGQTAASRFNVDSDSQITAVSPAGSGTVDVTVTAPGGISATSSADQFTYNPPPVPNITSISPSSGPDGGGTSVTITGTGFTGATSVSFGPLVVVQGNFAIVNDTQITVTSPSAFDSSAYNTTVDVTVTTPGGPSAISSADQFTYNPPPAPHLTATAGQCTSYAYPSPSPTPSQSGGNSNIQGFQLQSYYWVCQITLTNTGNADDVWQTTNGTTNPISGTLAAGATQNIEAVYDDSGRKPCNITIQGKANSVSVTFCPSAGQPK